MEAWQIHAPTMTSFQLRSPGDGSQSTNSSRQGKHHGSTFSENFSSVDESVPIKRGQHFYQLQKSAFEEKPEEVQRDSNFLSASQEELDKLLEGLDRLTETLPDLDSVRPYSALSNFKEPANDASYIFGSRQAGSLPLDYRDNQATDRQNSLIRPSMVAKQISSGLQSRETYNSVVSAPFVTTQIMTTAQPYHTRTDSKPFSYIRTSSRGPSRTISRASSREGIGQPGLESPGLLRKIMSGGDSDSGSRPISPTVISQSISPTPHQRQMKIDIGPKSIYSTSKSSEQQHQSTLIRDASHLSDEQASLTWLQRQQRKLQERRDAQRRRIMSGGSATGPVDHDFMQELKTSLHRARSDMDSLHDGYMSDTMSFRFSETSRESSPHKTLPLKSPQPLSSSTPKGQQSETKAHQIFLNRQKSDSSFDRSRPLISRRLRYDSETEDDNNIIRLKKSSLNGSLLHTSNNSIDSFHVTGGFGSQPNSRPITPGFPNTPTNPSSVQNSAKSNQYQRQHSQSNGTIQRASSPSVSTYQPASSRRGSVSSEPADVSPQNVKLVKDSHKFWYKPHISREEAIALLRHGSPGTFVVRDSNSFPGAFGLALKVSCPPVPTGRVDANSEELVRHFLIEPTSKGVKLKGYNNEPVFASLSALVYQHSLTPLALPTKLILPNHDLTTGSRDSIDSKTSSASQMQLLLSLGAACNVYYLFTLDTDSLTGPVAVRKAVAQMIVGQSQQLVVHFKVSSQGITLTDNHRKQFFRKHYNTATISYCGLDPEDRRFSPKGGKEISQRIFGFVAKKPASLTSNQCHVFAELDPDQPARAIVNFVNKVLLNNSNHVRSDVV